MDANDYFNNGNDHFDKKDYEQAIADYTETVRLNPNYIGAYFNRGLAYSNKKDYDRAIVDYTDVIRLDPNNDAAYNNRGIAYRIGRKDNKQAAVDFETAMKLKPGENLYHENLWKARHPKLNELKWFGKLLLKSNVITISVLIGVAAVGLFFVDAFTPPVTEITTGGESLTRETGARFYVPDALKVKNLDGKSVKWSSKLTANAISVLLPPGFHTFALDFESSDGDTKWSAKDLQIGTDFEAGKYYRFNHTLDKETKKISYSIRESDPVVYKTGFDPEYGSLIASGNSVCGGGYICCDCP
jgi:tetratricopeptide (TPR) repeat protein